MFLSLSAYFIFVLNYWNGQSLGHCYHSKSFSFFNSSLTNVGNQLVVKDVNNNNNNGKASTTRASSTAINSALERPNKKFQQLFKKGQKRREKKKSTMSDGIH